MKTLYELDTHRYPTGRTQQVGDRDPIPPGWTDQAPPADDEYRFVGGQWTEAPARAEWLNRPQVLGRRKDGMRDQAREQFQATLASGFDDGSGTIWAATDDARARVLDLTQRIQEYRAGKVASALPNGKSTVKLRDASNTPHDVGPDKITSLAEQGSDFKDSAEDRLEELLVSIAAATSHNDLDQIDVAAGWP